jgi:triosephosphate isomerase
MRAPIFAANWKLNHGPTRAREFMQAFLASYPAADDRTVAFFPSALALHAVVDALRGRPDVLTGVQNIATQASGAFTGENSAAIAADAGARLVLVGHSERRHVFGEAEEDTAKKCALAVQHGLAPVLCVGETLEQRERGDTEAVVVRQLVNGLAALDDAQAATALLAYEPVWAIGTGRTATPADASTIHTVLRGALRDRLGARAAHVPILYGGSVNRENAATLLAGTDVDGLLVGGASLDADGWSAIVRS